MQTAIAPILLADPEVKVSENILRACVHCGFCNATCPTYQIEGNELEGPRGRIYLIKNILEENIKLTGKVVEHLDNCLSCFACMTTCPSGVHYSHLIDEARHRIEQNHPRGLMDKLLRALLAATLPYPGRFRIAVRMGALARPLAFLLPRPLRALLYLAPLRLPPRARVARPGVIAATTARRARAVLLTGCAQTVIAPQINDATVRLLGRIGCEVVIPPAMGCCGALVYHMGNRAASLPHMKRNIDVWIAEMERGGLDYIVINTSGCGTVVKDYGHIFRNDPEYRDKAARVTQIVRDVSEVAAALGLPDGAGAAPRLRVAYHDACSLQHGQRIRNEPRALLRGAGFEVVEIPEGYLCCGSAGTYNALKPDTAAELGRQKADHIATTRADVIAAGNVGCIEQIGHHTATPVVHTVELLDWATGGPKPDALIRIG